MKHVTSIAAALIAGALVGSNCWAEEVADEEGMEISATAFESAAEFAVEEIAAESESEADAGDEEDLAENEEGSEESESPADEEAAEE